MGHDLKIQIRATEGEINSWRPAAVCSCGFEGTGMLWRASGKVRAQVWAAARRIADDHRREVARQEAIEADPFFGI